MIMHWIINNPVDAIQLAWALVLKPSLFVVLVIAILWLVLAKSTNLRRTVLRRGAVALGLVLSLVISSVRVCHYAFPALNTEPGHENYRSHFNDVQSRQIVAARKYGIQPLKNRDAADSIVASGKLVRITSTKNYQLASMSHSVPYLTENASALLDRIGKNFRDSLDAKGLAAHRIKVTSILRTDADVERLMKRNSVAVKNSAHRYATTFDISYRNFVPVSFLSRAADTELKMVLAEVLRDLRNEKLCYVKYEVSQGCFHITSRK
jgi:hypothetical protein